MLFQGIVASLTIIVCVSRADNLLYSEYDDVTILSANNVHDQIVGAENVWLVEFYNSYCGHCIRFASTYKELATIVKDWHPVVKIGAMACSAHGNSGICRDQNITGFPVLKFIKDHSEKLTTGEEYEGGRLFDDLEPGLIDYLESYKPGQRPKSCPPLEPLQSMELIWNFLTPETKFTVVIFEDESSYVGRKLQLDMVGYPQLLLRRMLKKDVAKFGIRYFPSMFLIDKGGTFQKLAETSDRNKLRYAIYELLGPDVVQQRKEEYNRHMEKREKEKALEEEKEQQDMMGIAQPDDLINMEQSDDTQEQQTQQSVSKVYMQDLLSGLHFSLRHEVALQYDISGEALQSLKNYMDALAMYFPGPEHVNKLLLALSQWLEKQTTLTGAEWVKTLNDLQTPSQYLPELIKWTGCRGSRSRYRGYPCSMWMTFHALTVNAVVMNPDATEEDPAGVILAINGYMDYFFGCRECSAHFVKKPSLILEKVRTTDDTIIYLWQSHNRANGFLHGDITEDPEHPKVPFPPVNQCPKCRVTNEISRTQDWEVQEVISYLKEMYRSDMIVRDEQTKSEQDEKLPSDDNKSGNNELSKEDSWLNFQQDIVKRKGDLVKLKQKKSQKRDQQMMKVKDKWKNNQQDINVGNAKLENLKQTELETRLVGSRLGFNYMDISMCVVFYVVTTGIVMLMYFHFSCRRRCRSGSPTMWSNPV